MVSPCIFIGDGGQSPTRVPDVLDRYSSGRERPQERLGRHVRSSQSPHSGLVPSSPYPARLGQAGVVYVREPGVCWY